MLNDHSISMRDDMWEEKIFPQPLLDFLTANIDKIPQSGCWKFPFLNMNVINHYLNLRSKYSVCV